jgi:ribosomal protein L16/L10AE
MQKKYFYKKYKIKLRQNFIIYDLSTCGFYQIRSITNNYLQFFNFESLRRLLSRKIKKKMNFILLKNSNKIPTFKKSLKVRMGSGKDSFNT